MLNRIFLLIILIFCSFGVFSESKQTDEPVDDVKEYPIEIGFSICSYYNMGNNFEESDYWVENIQQGVDLLAGIRVGALIHGGYRFTDEIVSGIEVGYLTYPIKEISLYDIPIRAYLKLGADWFNIKGFAGLLFRKGYYYSENNDFLFPASEFGYDIGARLESTIFYLEMAYSSSFGDKLSDITRYGAGISLTFDIN